MSSPFKALIAKLRKRHIIETFAGPVYSAFRHQETKVGMKNTLLRHSGGVIYSQATAHGS